MALPQTMGSLDLYRGQGSPSPSALGTAAPRDTSALETLWQLEANEAVGTWLQECGLCAGPSGQRHQPRWGALCCHIMAPRGAGLREGDQLQSSRECGCRLGAEWRGLWALPTHRKGHVSAEGAQGWTRQGWASIAGGRNERWSALVSHSPSCHAAPPSCAWQTSQAQSLTGPSCLPGILSPSGSPLPFVGLAPSVSDLQPAVLWLTGKPAPLTWPLFLLQLQP